MATAMDSPWISVKAAERRSGLTRSALMKAACVKVIACRALPGSPMQLSAKDVDRLAEKVKSGKWSGK